MVDSRKAICTLWLCTGVCMIVAALLRCILGLQRVHYINYTAIWAVRETVRNKFCFLPLQSYAKRRQSLLGKTSERECPATSTLTRSHGLHIVHRHTCHQFPHPGTQLHSRSETPRRVSLRNELQFRRRRCAQIRIRAPGTRKRRA